MIEDAVTKFDETTSADSFSVSQTDMLVACSGEAHRLAAALKALDCAIAEGLAIGETSVGVLQSVDLVCQEADGLAGVLKLFVEDAKTDRGVDSERIIGELKLRGQRDRFHSLLRHASKSVG